MLSSATTSSKSAASLVKDPSSGGLESSVRRRICCQVSLTGWLCEAKTRRPAMKEALLTALEPLLLTRAGALARALPGERRPRVQELSRAAGLRERLCRELREPETIPAALGL